MVFIDVAGRDAGSIGGQTSSRSALETLAFSNMGADGIGDELSDGLLEVAPPSWSEGKSLAPEYDRFIARAASATGVSVLWKREA